MTRIGYDSDTQCYVFRDADGSVYEGEVSGGNLRLVSRPGQKTEQGEYFPYYTPRRKNLTQLIDDEPLRLMPGRPAQPSQSPVESATSPTFQDMLPSHMIVSASSSKSSPSLGKHSTARSEDPSTSGSVLARIRSTPHGSPPSSNYDIHLTEPLPSPSLQPDPTSATRPQEGKSPRGFTPPILGR